MGGKQKYIEMFGSFTEPFNCCQSSGMFNDSNISFTTTEVILSLMPTKKWEHNKWNQSVWWSERVGWDGLDMLNKKMTMAGSNVVWHRRLKELDRWVIRKKSWWDCVKSDMESLGLSQKDAQFRNKWRRIKGQPGSPGKRPLKLSVCMLPPPKGRGIMAWWPLSVCLSRAWW